MEELERIKSSVLEIVERICPNSGDQWYDPEWGVGVRCAMSNTNFRESNKVWIVNGHTISPRTKELAIFPHLYRALGLEARHAVEAERAKHDVDLRSRDAVIARQKVTLDERLSVMRDRKRQIIDLESRATKLVEAVKKEINNLHWDDYAISVGESLERALAAHKKGGASNG